MSKEKVVARNYFSEMQKVHTPVGYDPLKDDWRKHSLTQQHYAEECDINHILKRFENQGGLPEMIHDDARYGDFSEVGTYQEAMETVVKAEQQFAALSAKVRARFGNDPANMLKFCSDPKNAAEMVELGLAVPREGLYDEKGNKLADPMPVVVHGAAGELAGPSKRPKKQVTEADE